MTRRNNKVVNVMRRAIEELFENMMQTGIGENTTMQREPLSNATRRLGPDLTFVASVMGTRLKVMMNISYASGRIAHEENTLQKVCTDKLEKYKHLAEEVKADRDIPVDIILVIVSSMGAAHGQSLQDLSRLFRCREKEMKRIGTRLSEAAITGSLEIWRRYAREVTHEEDPQIRQIYAQEALMMGDEQESDNQNEERDK
jgi:hypothetical protein